MYDGEMLNNTASHNEHRNEKRIETVKKAISAVYTTTPSPDNLLA
jgi:hypothetical protein